MTSIPQGWRKSSYSNENVNCVELNQANDMIRDSKNEQVLPLTRRAVAALVRAVRAEKF